MSKEKLVPLNLLGGGPTIYCKHYELDVAKFYCNYNCIRCWSDCPRGWPKLPFSANRDVAAAHQVEVDNE